MVYLAAAVVFVGLLGLVNFVITAALVRRMKVHTELFNQLADRPGGGTPAAPALPARTPIGDFTTTTIEGAIVSSAGLVGETLIGFFAPGCTACTERFPDFLGYAGAMAGGRQQVLAVVVGEGRERDLYVQRLAPVARVVVEGMNGPVATAFQVEGFPVFCLVGPDRTVIACDLTVSSLRAMASV